MADFTKQQTLNTVGDDVLEFDTADIENASIKADADWLLYYNSLQGNGYKVLSGVSLSITHQDYSPEAKAEHKRTRILAKVAAGTTTAYVMYQGKIT